jgi:hypothetical protein
MVERQSFVECIIKFLDPKDIYIYKGGLFNARKFSRKGMPGAGLQSFTMVSRMLLSHGSQAVQTSRFSAARVTMDTCRMWYVERFWNCSL